MADYCSHKITSIWGGMRICSMCSRKGYLNALRDAKVDIGRYEGRPELHKEVMAYIDREIAFITKMIRNDNKEI